ncbi:DUF190 domain-containing protein [uncultured Methylophaga sp.]|jgi:hypothetical protein|uniref:DUF190 domain-containing protein n=1 Tax=uncultured Methylophaga sp. TaxID=285271 RepID=UPI0026305A05|nr:DUF190 domain-containing protein [uncultured Methylophaga sp.]
MSQAVTMARIYLIEGRDDINKIITRLVDLKANGFTVFKGVAGLGSDHRLHKASLLALSSELPIIIEFFDKPERVTEIIEQLGDLVKPELVISWSAQSGI